MNKIIRYFEREKISIYPNYYVASDTLVNIQIYDEILKSIDKFDDSFVAIPTDYKIKNGILSIKKRQDLQIQELPTQKNKKSIDRDIINIKKKAMIINHQNTGYSSIQIAAMMKPENIYLIGLDESYQLPTEKLLRVDKSDNKNYFDDSYLKSGEYVSPAPISRINDINNLIEMLQPNINIYNLSSVSKLVVIYLLFFCF
jgi:hypothetical protein